MGEGEGQVLLLAPGGDCVLSWGNVLQEIQHGRAAFWSL